MSATVARSALSAVVVVSAFKRGAVLPGPPGPGQAPAPEVSLVLGLYW